MGARFFKWRCGQLSLELLNTAGWHFQISAPEAYLGYPVFLQKPLHVILLSFTSIVTGFHFWTGAVHSLVYSLGTIVISAIWGKRLFGQIVGLLAGTWLCFQPFHIHYSRLALHEMDAMLLLTAGFLFWVLSWNAHRSNLMIFLSAMLLMFSVAASYRLIPFILLIFVLELLKKLSKGFSFLNILKTVAAFLSGLSIPLLLMEAMYYFSFFPYYLWSQESSYLALLRKKFFSSESSMDLHFLDFYPRMFIRIDGLLPVLVVGFSILSLLINYGKPHRWRRRMLAVLFLLPYILFSLTTTRLTRTPTSLLPIIAVAVGVFIVDSTGYFKNKTLGIVLMGSVFVLCIGQFILKIPPIYSIQSGYSEVFDFLKRNNQEQCLTTMKPIYAWYLGRDAALDPGKTMEELCDQVRDGKVRYLCMDWQKYVRYWPSFQYIETHAEPVLVIPNPVTNYPATLHENYLPQDFPYLPQLDPTIYSIKIYDLYDILPKVGCWIDIDMDETR